MIQCKLSRVMGEKRIKQSQLAQMTGIRPNTINDLYHEIADRVSLEQLDMICEALDCDLGDILVRPNDKHKGQRG